MPAGIINDPDGIAPLSPPGGIMSSPKVLLKSKSLGVNFFINSGGIKPGVGSPGGISPSGLGFSDRGSKSAEAASPTIEATLSISSGSTLKPVTALRKADGFRDKASE